MYLVLTHLVRNNFGISLRSINCETLNAVQDHLLSRDLSELFLAQKSSKQNGNTFCNCLVAAFGFMMLTLLGTSFLRLAIVR